MRTRLLAQEELSEENPDVGTPQEEIAAFIEAPENDMAEAADAENDIKRAEDEVDNAAGVADRLDQVADRVEETLPEGGMSEADAGALEVAVEGLIATTGIRISKRKLFPSLENFADPKDRVIATRATMESIREGASKLWQAILNGLKKAYEFVQRFIDSIIASSKGLQRRCEALLKAVPSSSGDQADKIKGNALLVSGSKALGGEELVTAYEKHVGEEVFKKDRLGGAKEVFAALEKALEAGDSTDVYNKVREETYGIYTLTDIGAKVQEKPAFKAPEGALVEELVFPIGNKSLFAVLQGNTDKEGTLAARMAGIGASKSFMGATTGAAEVKVDEVTPVTADQVKKLVKAVLDHLKTYDALGKQVGEFKNASADISKKIEAAGKKASAEEGKQDDKTLTGSAMLSIAGNGVRATSNVLVSGTVQLRSFDLKLAHAVINFAGASLKAYGKSGDLKLENKPSPTLGNNGKEAVAA